MINKRLIGELHRSKGLCHYYSSLNKVKKNGPEGSESLVASRTSTTRTVVARMLPEASVNLFASKTSEQHLDAALGFFTTATQVSEEIDDFDCHFKSMKRSYVFMFTLHLLMPCSTPLSYTHTHTHTHTNTHTHTHTHTRSTHAP